MLCPKQLEPKPSAAMRMRAEAVDGLDAKACSCLCPAARLRARSRAVWTLSVVHSTSFTTDGAESVGGGGWGYTRCAQCFVTQAGVSIGLAKQVGLTFPDWGDSLCNLLVSVIVLNQIIGPPLFKIALIQAGDANPDKLPSVQRQQRPRKLSAFVPNAFMPRGITPVELSQLS